MTYGTVAFRVFNAIASSAPEPLTWRQVAQRTGLAEVPVQRAIARAVRSRAVMPTRRLDGCNGHAYTVAP
jgi:hypothetical protein